MNDDWRLQVDFEDEGHAARLMEHFEASELEHDLSEAFHDRVIVSRNGSRIFLYAGDRSQAEAAGQTVESLAARHGWKLSSELRRWHPVAEEWKGPDVPIPHDEAALRAEHEALIATERRETEERGTPEFEVRVETPSWREAVALKRHLRDEGLPAIHRGHYVLVGVTDEDSAKTLAERLRGEAPVGSDVLAEGTWQATYGERPPSPFAIFGGLGG